MRGNHQNKEKTTLMEEEREIQPAPSSLKAKIWTHFGFYRMPGKTELDMSFIVCRICKSKIKHFGNTTNARAHITRHHPELMDTAQSQPPAADQRTLHCFTKLSANSERAKQISRSIACFIAKDLRPYSVVENEGFICMLQAAEPRYAIPSRKFFTETAVPQLYQETKRKVASALTKTARVALTCDAWTSRATQSFVTFTAHYITDTWLLESRVLQTRVMHESHTAVNVNAMFHSVAEEWGLTVSDLVIVTDNAANMLAATQIDNLAHITCFAHTLNLAAQRALKLTAVSRLLGRIRRITGFFHRSTIANHELQEKQKLLQLPVHKLKTDVPTRWNSALDMIERFLEQQPAICAALLSPNVRRCGSDICTLSETDVSTAEEIASALKPMKEATHIMSEDSTPTLSVIAPLHAQLLHDTGPAGTVADAPVIREIKRAIHEDMAKRYSSARDKRMLYAASLLDPRFKALPFLTQEDQLEVHANIVGDAAAFERRVNLEEAEVMPGTPQPDPEEGPAPKRRPSALVTLLGKTFVAASAVRKSASTRAEEELKKYLEAPPLSLSEDPLSWWSTHETGFPLLARQAKRYLCVPGTSVAAERVFSTAGDIVTAQRSSLTPAHVDQLLFLQKNLDVAPANGQ
ncbi:Zinc finger BED domain-containing protein 1 [Merluccius polli]|uniref:Zinc finger BED domain-containing protein 1 n=1 Tax=Merluccius polli TaxID=89951 RepID=A0AA47MVU4_MERPO|nr:Zinc finger BED domain-containing protein 1 [Merluccius polli]KAK0146972.1 Zinc finger BED domain-containing protein 1 [Merluccius polli]KAK0154389.1 Zinc finger BED domain-containing protein 1 [Merluccius polli]